jgi:hypothetical protein
VKLRNFDLTFSEGKFNLTIPVEPMLKGHCEIGVALIRRWDQSEDGFTKEPIFVIKRNIFAALEFINVRNTNPRCPSRPLS